MKMLSALTLTVAAFIAVAPADGCDTLQTFRSFYAPAFAPACGCDAGVLQAPLYAPQVFSAPIYAPRVFAAPVYAPRVFAAPAYAPAFGAFHAPVLRAAVATPAFSETVIRDRGLFRRTTVIQRNVFGGAVVPASGVSIRAPFFRLNSFRF